MHPVQAAALNGLRGMLGELGVRKAALFRTQDLRRGHTTDIKEHGGRLCEIYSGGEGSGWVELYNPATEELDASGRRIGVFPAQAGSYILPPQTTIAAGERLIIFESELAFELDRIQALILDDGRGLFIDAFNLSLIHI